MQGTVAITDYDWYRRLYARPDLDEVNFWKPSPTRAFRAPEFSPFFFKLRARDSGKICGFGYFARYSRLPDWLAWETFDVGNGCETLAEMRERISEIRERVRFRGPAGLAEIGCVLIVQPTFFPESRWVDPPSDWPVRTQSEKGYDLSSGEGARVWRECRAMEASLRTPEIAVPQTVPEPAAPRYGAPVLVAPRLGQGTFRIAVTEAYGRSCAVTGEHSLPALEAAHIRSYKNDGPHRVANGILLRADFHRLLDKGYVTMTNDYRLVVGRRLRQDFENGRSYYPFQGREVDRPKRTADWPAREYLEWHRANVFIG